MRIRDEKLKENPQPAPRGAARDCVLLRLRAGDAARLDAACRAANMNRSRFCREKLVDLLEALAPKLRQVEERGGLAAVLESGLRPPVGVAGEFDALFNAPDCGS